MSSHDEYESGPYCKHWSDPGSCEECARESEPYLGLAKAHEALEQEAKALRAQVAGMTKERDALLRLVAHAEPFVSAASFDGAPETARQMRAALAGTPR